jgi:hypothetical protein
MYLWCNTVGRLGCVQSITGRSRESLRTCCRCNQLKMTANWLQVRIQKRQQPKEKYANSRMCLINVPVV